MIWALLLRLIHFKVLALSKNLRVKAKLEMGIKEQQDNDIATLNAQGDLVQRIGLSFL